VRQSLRRPASTSICFGHLRMDSVATPSSRATSRRRQRSAPGRRSRRRAPVLPRSRPRSAADRRAPRASRSRECRSAPTVLRSSASPSSGARSVWVVAEEGLLAYRGTKYDWVIVVVDPVYARRHGDRRSGKLPTGIRYAAVDRASSRIRA
jgi:hypothetical protein